MSKIQEIEFKIYIPTFFQKYNTYIPPTVISKINFTNLENLPVLNEAGQPIGIITKSRMLGNYVKITCILFKNIEFEFIKQQYSEESFSMEINALKLK